MIQYAAKQEKTMLVRNRYIAKIMPFVGLDVVPRE